MFSSAGHWVEIMYWPKSLGRSKFLTFTNVRFNDVNVDIGSHWGVPSSFVQINRSAELTW